ncbi:transposase [Dehalococcoidales bacterium]|nr:transposase [Dehalococcoidales bacterium]
MDRNQGRRMTAEEKLGVVEEGRLSGATISEVCRRYQIHHTQFYRWERLTQQGALETLRNGTRRVRNGKREEWLVSEVSRLRAVVTELIAENLTLKRRSWFEAAPALFRGGEEGLAGYGGKGSRTE